eukprot:762568-Hanusia_phi.AAC.1
MNVFSFCLFENDRDLVSSFSPRVAVLVASLHLERESQPCCHRLTVLQVDHCVGWERRTGKNGEGGRASPDILTPKADGEGVRAAR